MTIMVSMRKNGLLFSGLVLLSLTSCRLGRTAEEIRTQYNNVERNLTFTFGAQQPGTTGGSDTRVTLVDNELEGVESRWESSDAIALFDFGAVFVDDPNAIALGYVEDADDEYGIDYAVFSGSAKSKMGEDAPNEMPFALVYPCSRFESMPSSSTSVTLTFDEQYGSLEWLRQLHLYAWGSAIGRCEDGLVTLREAQASCSSNLTWHSHKTGSEDIILDNKMSIIRFSMVVADITTDGNGNPDTILTSLNDYLGNDVDIDYIEVQNISATAPGISEATLDLASGLVSPSEDASSTVTVTHLADTTGVELREIEEQDATPVNHSADADSVAWGTTFYLSVPCPVNTTLNIHPMLIVHTRNTTTGLPGATYYGAVSEKTIKEGNYYMTAPIWMFDNKAKLDVEAKIYLYYHSSYVWSGDDRIDIY